MSKFSLSRLWSNNPIWICALVLFAILFAQGASLSLSDDEAYYWVLAQRPALGYAFHPPGVAWLIAAFQTVLQPIFGAGSAALARLPAALISSIVFGLSLSWIRVAGALGHRAIYRAALVLASFAGVFGASWMIVPDLPMMLGWMILFDQTWRICFRRSNRDISTKRLALLALGAWLALISKYTAVLGIFSAAASLWFWAPPKMRWRGIAAVVLGAVFALIPILIWNSRHEWGALLYQFHDRHGGASFSAVRYLRFWIINLVGAGPALVAYAFLTFKRVRVVQFGPSVTRYVFLWMFPAAAVFCVQPAFSDFKPHWALIVWFPAALELALSYARGKDLGLARFQMRYGLTLIVIAMALCQLPLIGAIARAKTGKMPDSRWDVSNDMRGWEPLREYLKERPELRDLPVMGSRYQTASQAAFALAELGKDRVELIPRDVKQKDEWPSLGAVESVGPQWPRLIHPVLFVADHRYSAGPEFVGARCEKLERLETWRCGMLAKWVDVYRCDPVSN